MEENNVGNYGPLDHAAGPATAQAPGWESELDRVREIILGNDAARNRLQKPEADRLREIIFGAQMEEYGRQFADLKREMAHLLADLRQAQERISDIERAQLRRLDSLEQEARRINDELRRAIEHQRRQEAALQQLLAQSQQQNIVNHGVADATDAIHKTLDQQARELRILSSSTTDRFEQQARSLQSIRHELHQSEEDLRAELRRLVDRLDHQKTDRKALATMLVELATRLETGDTLTSLLHNLTTTSTKD